MKNILIFHKNWLGDVLFQIPVIEAIRDAFPSAHIACAAPNRCREILLANPAVDEFIPFDEKKTHRSWIAKIKFTRELRKRNWDRGYLLHRSKTRAALLWLGGVCERIGYAKGRSRLLTTPVPEPENPMHQVDYFLHLVSQSGILVRPGAAYRFYFSREAEASAQNILSRHGLTPKSFVCFHLGANWEPKRWPCGHFAKLADLIAAEWDVPVVVTGASGDLKLFVQFKRDVHHAKVISLIGETGLEGLAAVFQKAACLVTGDSGPMHIASGTGTPVLALFGPTDPKGTGPRGTGETEILSTVPEGYSVPWYGKNLPENGWLSAIQPEEVFAALRRRGWIRNSAAPSKTGGAAQVNGGASQGPMRILFITLTNIGDAILTTPVLMSLRARFPQAEITVVCGTRARGILQGSRFIDRLIVYNKKAGWWRQLPFVMEVRKQNYDLVVDLRNTVLGRVLVNAKKRSPWFRRFRHTLMRERHLDLLRMMKLEVPNPPPFDFFSSEEEASMLEKIREHGVKGDKEWILMAPVAASGLKTWPLEKYRSVIRGLLKEGLGPVLLAGDERERQLSAPLETEDPDRVINLAGKLTIRETAALISRCALLVTNDSALMHLGFEMNRPVTAVFGPTDPAKYGREGKNVRIVREPVFCSPCEKPVCRFERQSCFEDLSPEKVLQACKELLHDRVAAVR